MSSSAPTQASPAHPAPPVRRAPITVLARRRVGQPRWYTYALLWLASAACVFPLYWMFVVSSLDSSAATRLPPVLVPGGNFPTIVEQVFTTVPFFRAMLNSLVVAVAIGAGHALLCSLAGYAFAKLHFRGRNTLFVLVVLTMTVPAQLGVIPQYIIIAQLDWVNSLQALIVPGLANAFGIFWMRQHIANTISDELLHAARVDGCNSWQIYWRIVLPVIRPAAFVLGLFGFVTAWNDFLWPFIVLKTPDMYTVQIAIKALQRNLITDIGLAMAGSFLATIPLFLVFVFVGRRMVSGIMDGAFRG